MLMLAGVDVENHTEKSLQSISNEHTRRTSRPKLSYKNVSLPLRTGVIDLRQELSHVDESVDVLKTLLRFILQYKVFFIFVCVLIGIFVVSVLYISNATDESEKYNVSIDEGDSVRTIEGSPTEK
jgi:hypothetical protein